MIMALTIAVLVTGSVYLILQRGMVRIVFGMSLFGHASNLSLLAAGVGAWRGQAFPSQTSLEDMSDPLPQAFVLTAIVIAMATTTILLMLAALGHHDDTFDDESGRPRSYTDNNIVDQAPDADMAVEGPSPLTTAGRTASKSLGNNGKKGA
ncbi:cation:proton antiporter subunit C [Corynebacterium breve]|uniref:Cation:proton antiporter subunit C n=1 Tax=Corynebacterium breve TaxID=3049799 RepID=A0ABY8VK24_9CORY|nr:cation:proton antiporter subunit C [Corynebacterium breve]WIM67925.1 cation:proton antiporter subunit C [Corynebacterium breve]